MDVQKTDTAVVFIDPQNDVLSVEGANWGSVGASVTENGTVEHMEQIFQTAKANGYHVFISPHYFYPDRRRLDVQRAARDRRVHHPHVRPVGSAHPAGFPWLGRRLARSLQALHRGWGDDRR